jgi:phosphoribosylanthranilate isomerase
MLEAESALPLVKICCISTETEAATAIEYGAAALGLVSEMPSGPGVIAEELIARIVATVPPGIGTFLLTSRQDAGSIVAQQRRCGTNTVQICDRLEDCAYARLRRELPGIRLVQVIHVAGADSADEALVVAPEVDALLLDSGNQTLEVKELGGTGRTHDWRLSRQIREFAPVPVFLAGGVRTQGRLDPAKLAAFMSAVAAARNG